jgi:LmbE family N-acetylglucosaminyl deacetylase
VVNDLARLIRQSRPQLLVTHAYEGGHPDHDGLAVAVAALARNPDLPRFVHLEFAAYHEGSHGQLVTERFPDHPSCSATRVQLTPAEQAMKRRMLRCFSTQRRTLAPFRCEQEWLRQAPAYDFMTPPNQGRVWFDRYDWRVPRAAWCRRIQAVLPPTSGSGS